MASKFDAPPDNEPLMEAPKARTPLPRATRPFEPAVREAVPQEAVHEVFEMPIAKSNVELSVIADYTVLPRTQLEMEVGRKALEGRRRPNIQE